MCKGVIKMGRLWNEGRGVCKNVEWVGMTHSRKITSSKTWSKVKNYVFFHIRLDFKKCHRQFNVLKLSKWSIRRVRHFRRIFWSTLWFSTKWLSTKWSIPIETSFPEWFSQGRSGRNWKSVSRVFLGEKISNYVHSLMG